DIATDLFDRSHEFMSHNQRDFYGRASPLIPFVDVQVCSADSGSIDPDQDVVDTYGGDRNFLQPEATPCFLLYKRFHDRIILSQRGRYRRAGQHLTGRDACFSSCSATRVGQPSLAVVFRRASLPVERQKVKKPPGKGAYPL